MTMKFKAGDKVVVIITDWGVPVGTESVIRYIQDNMCYIPNAEEPSDLDYDDPFLESELEFAEVFNSNLYKYLKE